MLVETQIACPSCHTSHLVAPLRDGSYSCLNCYHRWSDSSSDLDKKLQQYFGHEHLHPYQQEIIEQVIAGKDALAVLPTGSGKSVIYQLPALDMFGTTIVISPLIALMQDQVDTLDAIDIPAVFINSTLSKSTRKKHEQSLLHGDIKLLYTSPESLPSLQDILQQMQVSLLAVDEAHCISQWGHDFRPKYRQLAKLRELFPQATMLALTASATPETRRDIIEQLEMHNPYIHIGSFDRPNLNYSVTDKYHLKELIESIRNNIPSIIYTKTTGDAESLSNELNTQGISSVPYHSKLKRKEKLDNQDQFMSGSVDTIVATTAFGMGVNKHNVRSVIHWNIPDSMERYHQETGRAGRDGSPAECILLFDPADISAVEFIIGKTITDEKHLDARITKFKQMRAYATSGGNYRQQILDYFAGGE
jgi:ATP-dependent DNA helicase RecQ